MRYRSSAEFWEALAGGTLQRKGALPGMLHTMGPDQEAAQWMLAGLNHDDPVVAMRCALGLAEQVHAYPQLGQPLHEGLFSRLSTLNQPEVQWHVARVLGRLDWAEEQVGLVADTLMVWLEHNPHKFAKVECLQGLTQLALSHAWLRDEVRGLIDLHEAKGPASMRARCRKLRKALGKA